MQLYNPVKRLSTEKVSSNDTPPEFMQVGRITSKINTAYTFIPCDIKYPRFIIINPAVLGTVSANGVALYTTVVGWEVVSFDVLSAVTNLDAHAAAIAYDVGNLVKATRTGSTEKAYMAIEAHTSTAGPDFDTDFASGYWLELATTQFIKVTHTAAGADKVAHFHYAIFGQ